MRTKMTLGFFLLLMGIFQISCVGSESGAMKALKRMKAKDYFESDLQARFADAVARGGRTLEGVEHWMG